MIDLPRRSDAGEEAEGGSRTLLEAGVDDGDLSPPVDLRQDCVADPGHVPCEAADNRPDRAPVLTPETQPNPRQHEHLGFLGDPWNVVQPNIQVLILERFDYALDLRCRKSYFREKIFGYKWASED